MHPLICSCGLPYADDEETEQGQCRLCSMWSHHRMDGITLDEARAEEADFLSARETA